jgi:hypothetical protein
MGTEYSHRKISRQSGRNISSLRCIFVDTNITKNEVKPVRANLSFVIVMALGIFSLSASAGSLETLREKLGSKSSKASAQGTLDVSAGIGSTSCTTNQDCTSHQECSSGQCVCEDGYITVEGGATCGYNQKSQSTAMGLTAGFGWMGGQYYYLHRWKEAGAATALSVGGTAVAFTAGGIAKHCGAQSYKTVTKTILGLVWIPAAIWEVVDLFRVGFNKLRDSNDQKLQAW